LRRRSNLLKRNSSLKRKLKKKTKRKLKERLQEPYRPESMPTRETKLELQHLPQLLLQLSEKKKRR